MALRIATAKDSTKGLKVPYLHITEYYRNKDGSKAQFPVKYFDDADRDVELTLDEDVFKKVFVFELAPEEIGAEKIEALAYGKIAAELIAAGETVESDESGSWVEV